MAADVWTTRALPLLRFIADHENERDLGMSFGDVGAATGMTAMQVDVELDRLIDGGYAHCIIQKIPAGPEHSMFYRGYLLERGARTVGTWPADDPYEEVLALLGERMHDDNLPDETRTKLERVHTTLVDVGKGVAGELLAALIRRQTGLG